MGGRINTVMQPCFFQLAGVLPAEEAIERIKGSVEKTYGKRGEAVVAAQLRRHRPARWSGWCKVPAGRGRQRPDGPVDRARTTAPDFVQRVTALMMAGEGDLLPVSALPVDGTFPTGTTRYEKRAIAQQIPIWDPSICIDCGKCAMVCPHAAIRMKVLPGGRGRGRARRTS